ncbi:MAG: hybrid sensor histidine kinase/response regulator [Gammaproteobacteria bacterium]|nr:MAG: hybrid sensor histidine kinase/response regulator [Gammaproteobacteria bacterium]
MAVISKRHLNLRSAYGQLIVLVFLPICLLAIVGSVLVYKETQRITLHEQQAIAKSVLIRYQPIISQKLPQLLGSTDDEVLQQVLLSVESDTKLNRVAIVNSHGEVIKSIGFDTQESWGNLANKLSNQLKNHNQQSSINIDKTSQFVTNIKTEVGTAYGLPVRQTSTEQYWLIVDMDNKPIDLARYRILLTLTITCLFTLLFLLFSLQSYASRWLAPIYEMRLYLQKMRADTLDEPVNIKSKGEVLLLSKDLQDACKRLNKSFKELKEHAEQTEDDLRQAFDEMEMQNISIRNARDMAISTSQAKSAFLANISHELRTPLNSIDGFVNLLARHEGLNDEQNLYVQTIRKSSAHLLALVNDVLDFSKIEAGKLVLDNHEYNFFETIYEVADMLSPLASEKGLRMAVVFYNDVPMHIIGDALRMKQIMTNLVGNAIKFTDDGEIVISVKLDDDKENHLHISVQDSGRGVSKQDREQLFKSFTQGDPSITRQYGGTGLGLVISQQLTRLMGGHIGYLDNKIENIATHGSTFWFSLPAQVDVLDVESVGDVALPEIEMPPSLLASDDTQLRVLVWINHAASIQVLQASLQPLPISITKTNSLASTLDKLEEQANQFDWVIVDSDTNETQDNMTALLKQIRLHYQGRLGVYGYQVALDMQLLNKYQAYPLYEPLNKNQLYAMFDSKDNEVVKPVQEVSRWQGCRVLAVDDHPPNLLVLEALLDEFGIEVVTANSGFDAIEIVSMQNNASDSSLDKKPIDLIFMDIQMPKMSGHQAAAQIRKVDGNEPPIPIVALTAHGMSDERDQLMRSGIDDYVSKPINQQQLVQILQKWLSNKTGQNLKISKPNAAVPSNNTSQALAESQHNKHVKSYINMQTDLAVIDWEDALARSVNKPDLASQLIIMMIDSVSGEKQALQQAWQANDIEQLSQISHRILGASRYAGVPQIRHASQSLEDACLQNIEVMATETNMSEAKLKMNLQDIEALQTRYDELLIALDNLAKQDLSPWAELKYHRFKEDDMTWKMI